MHNKEYLQVFILDTDLKIVPFIYIPYLGDSPLISPTHLLLHSNCSETVHPNMVLSFLLAILDV